MAPPTESRILGGVRGKIAADIFARVAGENGPAHARQVHLAAGPRWFEPESPIRAVHSDASMFVGGLRALLLQSLHPLAMAGVAEHSDYRGDPWGRLARTSHFLATTTFGTTADAEAMIKRIKRIHERVQGVAADGRPYRASDPHLLKWVHLAEADSFLRAYQRYGSGSLDQGGRDQYLRESARVAEALGVIDAPRSETELVEQLRAYRPELSGTADAREAARFLLLQPPLPLAARGPYAILGAAAVGLLPRWTRWPLRLPYLPIAEATVVRLSGQTLVRTIRWALSANPPAPAAPS